MPSANQREVTPEPDGVRQQHAQNRIIEIVKVNVFIHPRSNGYAFIRPRSRVARPPVQRTID